MNLTQCQMSRSFSDLGPKSLGLYIHQHFKDFISENAGPISIKFHVQLQGRDGWVRGREWNFI